MQLASLLVGAHLVDTSVLSAIVKPTARKKTPLLVARFEELVRTEGLAIAGVTLFEQRRGVAALLAKKQGKRIAVDVEKLLRSATVLGLDERGFLGWELAASLWAEARAQKPAVNIEDGDLLIAATALHHGRRLLTTDGRLVKLLRKIGHEALAEHLALE